MADAPKKDFKKPAAPAPTTLKGGKELMWEFVGVLVAMLFLASVFSGSSWFKSFTSNETSNSTSTATGEVTPIDTSVNSNFDFWKSFSGDGGSFPSSGNPTVGGEVLTKGRVDVRREPGGSVIGFQYRGEKGKIVDGPVDAYGSRWFMLDFDTPPGGWVEEKDITNKVFWFYVVNFFPTLWDYWKMIAIGASIIFLFVIIYSIFKSMTTPVYDSGMPEKKTTSYAPAKAPAVTASSPTNLPVSQPIEPREESMRWNHVQTLMKSHNPSDWRQAVIEADVMLENMLEKMGYPGVSIGDKLKNAEEGEFATLDKAWEAHKVRNRIAHDGSGYKFAYEEASRVLGLYEEVFKEFYWI